jgi:hypothetical protein
MTLRSVKVKLTIGRSAGKLTLLTTASFALMSHTIDQADGFVAMTSLDACRLQRWPDSMHHTMELCGASTEDLKRLSKTQ